MADYLDDIVQNIVTKCDLSDFNLLIHATDDLAKKANKLSRAFNRALTGEQQVALAKSNEIISHNVARQKEATMALAEYNKEISWNKVLLAEQNRLKAENNNATKIATQDRDKQISQERLQTQLSKERTLQMRKETSELRKQSAVMRTLGRLLVTYFSIRTLQNIVNMGSQLQLLQRSIEGLTGSGQDWQFLNDQAYKFGISLDVVAKGYKNFFSSANMAGFNTNQIQGMFSDVLLGARSIGASTQQIEGALLALEQMMSKGRVSMEELRRQLGNALPGAFEIGAKAMGVTTAEFNDLVKAGLSAQEFVPKFIKTFKEQYANGWKDVEQTVAIAQGRLQVAWQELTMEFLHGESGKAFAEAINEFTKLLRSPDFIQFIHGLGEIFKWISKIATSTMPLINYLLRNLPIVIMLLGVGGLWGLMRRFPDMMALMTMRTKDAVIVMKLFGIESIKSFAAANKGALALGKAFLRALLPILVIQDVLLWIIGVLTGTKFNTVTGELIEIGGALGDVVDQAINNSKNPLNQKTQEELDNARSWLNTNKKYNQAKREGNTALMHQMEISTIRSLHGRGTKKDETVLGLASPIGFRDNTTPYYIQSPTPQIIPNASGYVGTLPDLGNFNKEQQVSTNVNIGDINIYSNGVNPTEVAEEVQNQLISLFMSQGLTLNVEGMVT